MAKRMPKCQNKEIYKSGGRKGSSVCETGSEDVIEWTAHYPHIAAGYVCRNCGYAWIRVCHYDSIEKIERDHTRALAENGLLPSVEDLKRLSEKDKDGFVFKEIGSTVAVFHRKKSLMHKTRLKKIAKIAEKYGETYAAAFFRDFVSSKNAAANRGPNWSLGWTLSAATRKALDMFCITQGVTLNMLDRDDVYLEETVRYHARVLWEKLLDEYVIRRERSINNGRP